MQRIHRILSCLEVLSHGVSPASEMAWQRCELTMPQFKALIYVARNDGATSGQIAHGLGVGLSTVTGIVDRLCEQNMVSRREDPRDRRINRVVATPSGRAIVEELFQYRNEMLRSILAELDPDQLDTVETAFKYLVDAVNKVDRQHHSTEVVA
jgi:DNA-binding MarR family transcriptional regulator